MSSYVTINVFQEQILKDFDLYFVELINENNDQDENDKIRLCYSILIDTLPFARSLYYRYHSGCFLLFDVNSVNRKKIVDEISSAIDIDRNLVKVTHLTVENFELIKNHEVCQLFMNNMVDNIKYRLQYLSGELLLFNNSIFPKNKIEPITAYKLFVGEVDKIKKRYTINIDVQSFYTLETNLKMTKDSKERQKHYNRPRYIFNRLTNKLERVFSVNDADKSKCYIKKSPYQSQNKNTTDALQYKNKDAFYNSKLGLLYKFMKSFNETCGKYVSISLQQYDFNNVEKVEKFNLEKLYKTMEIGIVDNVKNEISHDLIMVMKDYLKHCGVKINKHSIKKINLIYSPEYYKKNKIQDSYKKSFDYQNLIVNCEKWDIKKIENITIKCLHELLVKDDIKNKTLTLYNWKLSDDLKYTIRYPLTKKEHVYYSITINPLGMLFYDKFENGSSEYKCYDQKYQEHLNRYSSLSQCEAIIEYQDQTYILSQTGSFITPNLDELISRIELSYNGTMSRDNLRKYLIEASIQLKNPIYSELTDILDQDEYTYKEIISSDENYSLINIRKKEGKGFLEFMDDKGIILNSRLKSTSLKAYQHLHYFVDQNEAYYYVGSRYTVNQKIEANTLIRRIECVKGNLDITFIKEIFAMMQVDFVRNNQDSVFPFIHKYLNDYIKNI